MSVDYEELLRRLAGVFCPLHSLSPVSDAVPPQIQGRKHSSRARYLFTPKFTLWTTEYREHVCAFHVDELNFDTLAQCHASALETGMAAFDSTAKHNLTRVSAVILCNTAQADALEALVRFKAHMGRPLSFRAKLDYCLAAVDLSSGQAVCNRRKRKLVSALLSQIPHS